ncbi:MAG: hypothetical protein JKY65_27290 [Planctomycetes bacterium]|nr:hypothetical protein [Planctomycetota bacterium]
MEDDPAEDPYSVPKSNGLEAAPEAETVRRQHFGHEGSIKSVGWVFLLGGVALTTLGWVGVRAADQLAEQRGGVKGSIVRSMMGVLGEVDFSTLSALFMLVLASGVLGFLAGAGLLAMKPWGRALATLLSAIGMVAFPIGTLAGAYSLWVLHGEKGQRIFAADYRQIVGATPKVRRASWPGVVVLCLVALVVARIVFLVLRA